MGEFKSSQSVRITSRSCYLEDFIGMFRRICVCMNGIKQPFLCFQWAETICKHYLFQFTSLLCFTLQSVTTLNIITPALSCCFFFLKSLIKFYGTGQRDGSITRAFHACEDAILHAISTQNTRKLHAQNTRAKKYTQSASKIYMQSASKIS